MTNTADVAAYSSLEQIDTTNMAVRYDRESDTLIVHFYGVGLPGVSIDKGNGWFVRRDRERGRSIGVQIEGFLARAVQGEPALLDMLDIADLRGMTPEEVGRLRRDIALTGRRPAGADRVISLLWRFAIGDSDVAGSAQSA
ncbi:MAG TPA: hypothetical protein VFQ80_05415 [Thermomicrobiales bacterium]|nr:hypothetical protein [Thermomicrobiales bacterium]